jgi:SAM-dependent methyltransferase
MAAPDHDIPDKGDLNFSPGIAYSARVNNVWQGGKDNFAADRVAADRAVEAFPQLPAAVRAGIGFRARAVRYLAGAGVRQFLDLGCGLTAGDPVHVIAQAAAAGSRVVYVDNDPMVITHARALYRSVPEDGCGYLQADIRDRAQVLASAATTLDLRQPVGVLMASVLHLIPDSDDPYGLVREVLFAVAPGSYLLIVHPASDIRPDASRQMEARLNDLVAQRRTYRDHAQVTAFFTGLELVEPGIVGVPRWRPESDADAATPTMAWCGVGRMPLAG